MPTTRDTAALIQLRDRVRGMSAADQLRLAAELVSVGKYDLAEAIANGAVDALRALRLFGGRPS